jgi:hypothetical protein
MYFALEIQRFSSGMSSLSIAKAERSEVSFASNNIKSIEMKFAQNFQK